MVYRSHLVLGACALLWTACGGGSPSAGPAASAPSTPAEPAQQPSASAGPQAEPSAAAVTYDARVFHDTVSLFGGSFSHDETRVLVTSNESGVFNVYAQPVAGGEAVAQTDSQTESHFARSYFPGDDRFLFSADQGGNELDHLYVKELDGSVKDLTPGEGLKAAFFDWSGDKSHFFVLTNERDPQAMDVYRYRTSDYQRSLVFKNTGGFSPEVISPDGRYLALDKSVSNSDVDLYLYDAKAPRKAPRRITNESEAAENVAQSFSRDGKRLYYTTDRHGEFRQAWYYDLAKNSHAVELRADWDVSYLGFSDGGRYRVIATNEDARTRLQIYDTSARAPLTMPELPAGDITGVSFSSSETKMAFYLSSDTTPRNLYVFDIAAQEVRALSDTLNERLDVAHLVGGEVVRYPSFDELEIPAILYRPQGAKADTPAPALVWVHGGPGGQSRVGYSPTLQHLVNHGYAVLAVNNRGSSGYGKTFYHLDDRKHGDVDLKDCVWARRYLSALDWIDGERVGIIGGSYGGYMVLAALAFEPEAFELGIDIFGVSNWVRTLESIPPWWGAVRDSLYAELGDPAEDAGRLRRISPLFSPEAIVKPLLVIQGANDPRVLKVESDEIVEAVEKNGVPVEYVVFDDEGHGFEKKENRIRASESYLAFLRAHL